MIHQLRRAGADDLSTADYREIYDELLGAHSLRQFCALVGESEGRIAWWSKYGRGLADLGLPERNVLRRAIGLPELPASVGAIVAEIDADAEVWRIGESTPARRVLLISQAEPVTVFVNGSGPEIVADDARQLPARDAVTPVTAPRPRRKMWRPALPVDLRSELERRGLDLRQIIASALESVQESGT